MTNDELARVKRIGAGLNADDADAYWRAACNRMLEQDTETIRALRAQNAELLAAAKNLLVLIDSVPIDTRLGDETDRVFPRYEFDELRAAITKAEGQS